MSETIKLLTEIRDLLRDIRNDQRKPGAQAGGRTAAVPGGGEVASDRDLDSEWGNPSVRKDPPRWTGDSYVGCRFSECPPEYLDALASLFEWQAGKDEEQDKKTGAGKPTAPYKRKDAARARGWAVRIRSGWTQTSGNGGADEPSGPVNDEPLPF